MGEEEEEEEGGGVGGFEAVWPSSSTNTEEFLSSLTMRCHSLLRVLLEGLIGHSIVPRPGERREESFRHREDGK